MKIVLCFLFVSSLSWALPGYQYKEDQFSPQTRPVLKGIPFRDFKLSEFLDSTPATVLIFSGTHCPLVKQYLPTLESLSQRFGPQGVRFLAVYSDRNTSVFSMALHALKDGVPIRPVLDTEGRLAKLLGVEKLTEAVVMDETGKVIYQGAIDDQFSVVARKEAASDHYLADALDAHLNRRVPTRPVTTASGCTIEFPLPTPLPQLTYYRDVLPIIQNRCQSCHRTGEIGESYRVFETYDDVLSAASTIRDVVLDRRMPPYYTFVNPKFGKESSTHQLSPEEVRIIDQWVRQGAPEGNRADAPAAKQWPKTGWAIGKPDLIVSMPEKFEIKATGKLDYQFFRLRLNFPEDRWVGAVEAKPGNTKVVHHMQLHIVPVGDESFKGTDAMTKLYGMDGERGNLFHSYVPGDTDENARTYPKNQAARIPKNTDLILEMHYTTTGQVEEDQSSVGLKFAPGKPEVEICSHGFKSKRSLVKVAAGDEHHGAERMLWFRKDVQLHNIRAHMHETGKSFRLDWIKREEKRSTRELFAAFPIFDFNWQRSIQFEKPVLINAGQEILMTGYWDNSKFNPNNSDPTRDRVWGIHTSDEMLNVGLKFSIVDKSRTFECWEAVP